MISDYLLSPQWVCAMLAGVVTLVFHFTLLSYECDHAVNESGSDVVYSRFDM